MANPQKKTAHLVKRLPQPYKLATHHQHTPAINGGGLGAVEDHLVHRVGEVALILRRLLLMSRG